MSAPAPAPPNLKMQTITIPERNVEFTFTDSNVPTNANGVKFEHYTTFILVHGHTFHSGVFRKLPGVAKGQPVRIICINRRGYLGSTKYSDEELRIFDWLHADKNITDEQRRTLLNDEGLNLAFCVSGIIQQCALPANGPVALAGWSLGNTFTMAAMASITSPSLPEATKERLRSHVKTFILWDPPSHALGIANPPDPYVPLYDETIVDEEGKSTPKARGEVFGLWVASYFAHDFSLPHDSGKLKRRLDQVIKDKPATSFPGTQMYPDIIDPTIGFMSDTPLTEPDFAKVVNETVNKVLFEIRETYWPQTKVAYIWEEESTWNIVWAAWDIEERVQKVKGAPAPIAFYPIPGANHFVMWDDEKKTLEVLKECVA
ncbi:hypothetical protein FB451DRAFT_1206101 [Mycena latifolia]|nr:hypothetical protein FB451DRAFT_1206101 [Mycena latifolia]